MAKKKKEKMKRTRNHTFKTVIFAMMSSGKSTLINALLGDALLPSENQACTSLITTIIADNNATDAQAFVRYHSGKRYSLPVCDTYTLQKNQKKSNVREMFVKSSLPGIHIQNGTLAIVDTPGPNNRASTAHTEVTKKYLLNMQKGLILYILNAEQLGVLDDASFLTAVLSKMKSTPEIGILFALNKIDCLDTEKETLQETLERCTAYLDALGFSSPEILCLSAEAALLFRIAAKGGTLGRTDSLRLKHYLNYFVGKNPADYSIALSRTGIIELEIAIAKRAENAFAEKELAKKKKEEQKKAAAKTLAKRKS